MNCASIIHQNFPPGILTLHGVFYIFLVAENIISKITAKGKFKNIFSRNKFIPYGTLLTFVMLC